MMASIPGGVEGADSAALSQADEGVVSFEQAAAGAPRRRAQEHPWCELIPHRSRPLLESRDDFLFVTFEFRVSGPTLLELTFVTVTEDGRKFINIKPTKPNGEWNLASYSVGPEVKEAWIEVSEGNRAHPSFPKGVPGYKVSRSVILKQGQPITQAREWSEKESAEFERTRKEWLIPPKDHAIVGDEEVIRVEPGLPVMALWQGGWLAGTVASKSRQQGPASVAWDQPADANRPVALIEGRHLAVTPSNWAKKHEFKPRVVTLAEGTAPLPADCIVIHDAVMLVPGTPLLTERDGRLETVTYVGDTVIDRGFGEIPVLWDAHGNNREELRRDRVAIRKQDVELLHLTGAAEYFGVRLKGLDPAKENPEFVKALAPDHVSQFQFGEKVVPAAEATADAPRRRQQADPWIELKDFSKEESGEMYLVYRVWEGNPKSFHLVVKTHRGRRVIPLEFKEDPSPFWSGWTRVLFDPQGAKDIEIWAELEVPGSKANVPGIKVSKSKSVGNVKTTFARDLTPAEMERAR